MKSSAAEITLVTLGVFACLAWSAVAAPDKPNPGKAAANPAAKPSDKTAPKGKTAAAPATKAPVAKPAAPADPLAGLPKAVELPPLDAGKPKLLGKMAVADNAIIIISLLGADRVLPAGRTVELKEGDNGRSWSFFSAPRTGAEPISIAELRLEKQDLTFAWSESAIDFPGAAGLKNGALQISAGPSKRLLPLRTMQAGEALVFALEEPATVSVDLADAPRLDGVKMEFDLPTIEHGGKRVNWRIVGGATLKANDSVVAQSIRLPNLVMRVETSLVRGFKLTATPLFWSVDPKKTLPLTAKRLNGALGELKAYQAQLEAAQKQLGKTKSTPQSAALSKELSGVKKAIAELTTLGEFVDSKPKGVISYRLFHEVEGHPVDLIIGKKK